MLDFTKSYDENVASFKWNIPEYFNIGVEVCTKWALTHPNKTALIWAKEGVVETFTYLQLEQESNRLANVLTAKGIKKGDRVAILLAQGLAAALSHIALYKVGAIAVPLATLFGVDALTYRIKNSGAKLIIGNQQALEKIENLHDCQVLNVDKGIGENFYIALKSASSHFTPVNTLANDPAIMIYTSGTTGQPKGALHAHRVLLGHLPGVQMPHDGFPLKDDLMWTPADWAWAGGLLNILLPALYYGVPVLAKKFDKFDPDEAFRLMQDFKVKNTFIPPTALRMLRAIDKPKDKYKLSLRTIGSGGESLGAETFRWGLEDLGLYLNEFYGQTECNLVLASSKKWNVSKAGFIGKAVPGHTVKIVDQQGVEVKRGAVGQIAVLSPNPVMFLKYWQNEQATTEKYVNGMLMTGDQGIMDEEGYVTFHGRDDDIITSSGYRIGPTEIEDCLIRHKAVSLAAVVGKKDALRTEIVQAFVVLKKGVEESDELAKDIQNFAKERVSTHSYPREIVFVKELPMTTTGKVIRRLLRE